MNPGAFLAGGGAGGSGGDDSAGDAGKEKAGAGTENSNKDADGGGKEAPDPVKYPTCGTKAHPVDVVTGRAFTLPIEDLGLPGPLPFSFERTYSTTAAKEDMGLGWGWAHSLGWHVEVRRRTVLVWNDQGKFIEFPQIPVGASTLGDFGWVLRREAWGYGVDVDEGTWRIFADAKDERGEMFLLSAIEDRNKNKITLAYDKGHLVEITDSAGRTIKVKNTKEGRIASLEVKNAETNGQWIAFATYRYDERGDLVQVTDADGYSWHYEYDEFHRLVKDKDRVGLTFHFKYDTKDRCIESWGDYDGKPDPSLADDVPKVLADRKTRAKGVHHCKFDYGQGRYTEVADSTRVDRFFGNARGTLDKAVAGTATTTSRYDERGFEIERTDPTGGTWRWLRDERGRPREIVDPLGRRSQVERDPYGLPVRVTDPAGGVTQAWRDKNGNLETLRDAAGGTTQYTNDSRGLRTSVVDQAGAGSRLAYDAHGNLTEVVNPNGGVWRYDYDAFGRLRAQKDPVGAETRYAYSNRGDLVAVHESNGAVIRYSYDGEGHLTQILSAQGRTTQFTWGGFDKVCGRRDANGHLIHMKYSREGELVTVTNEAGQVHRLDLAPTGRLSAEKFIDGRTIHYRFDALGRPLRVANSADDVVEYAYDAAGQLVERKCSDGETEEYEYNACGELVRVKNSLGEVRFDRDPMGRIVRETQRVGDEVHWVDARYDEAGHLVELKTSLGHTKQVERDRDGGALRTLLDGRERIDHRCDLSGSEVTRHLGRGGRIETAYDSLGRVTERGVRRTAIPGLGGPQPLVTGKRYQYDLDDDMVSATDLRAGVTRFEYDPVGQLLAAIPENARAEIFRYDPAGNAFEAEGSGQAREYDAGNRPVRRGETTYAWDAAGRLSEKRERAKGADRLWKYSWNASGLLEEVHTPDGEKLQFGYDPFARRIEKTILVRDGGGWRVKTHLRFVWRGSSMVHALEAAGDDTRTTTYAFDDDPFEPVAQRTADEWFHYVNAPNGAPDTLVDATGEAACELSRSAWGEASEAPAARTTTPWRLLGQYEDGETGLHYSRARYYDPELGRFISADPIGIVGDLNDTRYAQNPLQWVDPLGLTALNKKGFSVYKLYHEGETEPYYVGITDDVERRECDHHQKQKSGPDKGKRRMQGNDRMEVTDSNLTYKQARGYEQAYIEHHQTLTGWPGNRCNSFDTDRTDGRAKAFNRCRAGKLGSLGGGE